MQTIVLVLVLLTNGQRVYIEDRTRLIWFPNDPTVGVVMCSGAARLAVRATYGTKLEEVKEIVAFTCFKESLI